jgi:sarcosine oxidase, subunit beta
MQTADVVIIGGGVIGASVAWHLASAGCRNVVVIDRSSEPGSGSTGRATGGFRAQFGSAINIRLSLMAREKLLHFEEETGVDPGFEQTGYLFLTSSPAQLDRLRLVNDLQRHHGVGEARIIDAREAAALNPAIDEGSYIGAAWSPSDGFLRPLEILRGYSEAAVRMGVRFESGTEAMAFEKQRGHLVALRTNRGEIAAHTFVNAAGAWAARVGEMAGVDVPVVPVRRQVAATVPTTALPSDMPMTIFADDGFHLRVRDGRVLLLWPDSASVEDPFETEVDDLWLKEVRRKSDARVSLLRDVPFDREASWAGLYEMSPDRHALLGTTSDASNLILVNGSSGHGVMHAPALGQLASDLILGRPPQLDIDPLRPSRFAEGKPVQLIELL